MYVIKIRVRNNNTLLRSWWYSVEDRNEDEEDGYD